MKYLFVICILLPFILKTSTITSQPDACYFQVQSTTYDLSAQYGICTGSKNIVWTHTLANAQISSTYDTGISLQSIQYDESLIRMTLKPQVGRTNINFDIKIIINCAKYKTIKYRTITFYLNINNKIMSDLYQNYFPLGSQTLAAGQGTTISVTGLSSVNNTGIAKILVFLYEIDISSTDSTFSKSLQLTCSILGASGATVYVNNRGSKTLNIFYIGFHLLRFNTAELTILFPTLQIIYGLLSTQTSSTITNIKMTDKNSYYGIFKFNHDNDNTLHFNAFFGTDTLTISSFNPNMHTLGANYFVIAGNNKCCTPTPFFQSVANLCYSSCPIQFYGSGNDCIKCSTTITNCIQCTDPTHCTKCTTGYFYQSGASCTLCNSIMPLCSQCSSASLCVTCNVGYFSTGSTCSPCSGAMPNCLQCSSNSICTKCVIGYFSSVSTCNLCNSTLNFCQQCTDSSHCTKCATKYYLNGLTCDKCSNPIQNCQACNSVPQCFTCLVGFYLDGLTCSSCTGLDLKCIECSDSNTCSKCDYGYFPTGKKCQVCTVYGQSCIECDSIKCINTKSFLSSNLISSEASNSFCSQNVIACIGIVVAITTALWCCLFWLLILCCCRKKEQNNNKILNVTEQTLNNENIPQGTLMFDNSNSIINQDQINLFQKKTPIKKQKTIKQQLTYCSNTPLSTHRRPQKNIEISQQRKKQSYQNQVGKEVQFEVKINNASGQLQVIQLDEKKAN